MTVSTEVNQAAYTGNGVTTVFPYTFRILNASNLTVTRIDLLEVETVLTLGTDYTVSGDGSYNGGSVVLTQALPSGYSLVIVRDLDIVQETDLRNQGTFFAEVHEDAFDYLTMIIQQVASWFGLALRRPTIKSKFYDAKNFKISNLENGTKRADAVTKGYVDDLFTGGVTPPDFTVENDIFTNHQRNIISTMPLLFPDYDTLLEATPAATYMYPQAFCVTNGLVYITYPFEPKQSDNVIVVYDLSGNYQGYYFVNAGGAGRAAEGIVVTSDLGGLKMYIGHVNGELREFNLAGAIYGSHLPLLRSINVGLYNQFSYRNGTWLVEQDVAEVGQIITRTVMGVFDNNFNRTSTLTVPLHDVGYVTETTSEYSPYFNKRQGILVGDNYFAFGFGGYFSDGAGSPGVNEYQGSKVFNSDGTKRTESMLDPQGMMDIMKSHGLNVTRIENEGLAISDDGKSIYSLYIHQERTGVEPYNSGLVIFEEYSTSKDAIDFVQASKMPRGYDIDHASIGVFPRSYQGMVNPVTGSVFTNLTEILQYMQRANQKEFKFYTGSVTILDISGSSLPASTYVEILNANNQTFIVNYYSADSGISYIIATNGSGDFVFLRQRPSVWASNITIQQNETGNQLNRLTASSATGATTNADKILVIDQQATASANGLVIGGSSSVFKSATTIDFSTNPTNTSLGGTVRFRIAEYGMRPFADNTYSLGQAAFRLTTVYAATGTINTSDERMKTDIIDLSEAERRVAVKLKSLIRRFKFKESVQDKGNDARYHFGIIAQQVKSAFEQEGLVAEEYGILCHDEWEDEYAPVMAVRNSEDDTGKLVPEEYDTGEKILALAAGDRYSVRYEELLCFIVAAI
ncbi:tail fiber domain-containing protein [Rahnella sp. FC061912-K]|uniref:tail fiber domain-containing protein n=1 Tax=Rahnella rivi TaxID=2816249 RepID=UPI001C25D0E6|nr:tail fiber domain-containing protein [Rahnella rivi]MBU9831278.1 tail fiber domain-containing protein [Rahnella rivi]